MALGTKAVCGVLIALDNVGTSGCICVISKMLDTNGVCDLISVIPTALDEPYNPV
jgi:hypothetical protein